VDAPTKLSEQQRSLLSYCEQQWFLKGRLPTPQELCKKYSLTPSKLNEWLNSDLFKQNFEARGMPIIQGLDLTPTQITVINTLMNLADTRSERKKLSDLGISASQWSGWKRDPAVMEYMRARSEQILEGAIPDAHLALVEKVQAGDMSALKFYYEMTGRYTGQRPGMDPQALLTRVFDIIAKHVNNIEVLDGIAHDFLLLAGVDRLGNMKSDKPPVAGEIVQEQTIDGGF
jgi:hypothetical protein